jgi:glycosyltransferase involved in cell wall biosynthesis
MTDPLVSIVTIVLNNSEKIESTIKSVLIQSYTNIEYIIIDGGSTDGTLMIIDNYKNKISKILSEPDKGIYDAMNKGIALSTGEWIIFLNSGDRFSEGNVLSGIFNSNAVQTRSADIIYSDVIIDNGSRKKIRKAKSLRTFWHGLPFSHQSCIVRTKFVKQVPFSTQYKICSDYDSLYPLYLRKSIFFYYENPISIIDITTGISRNCDYKFLYKEFLTISKKHSSSLSFPLICIFHVLEFCIVSLRRSIKELIRFR